MSRLAVRERMGIGGNEILSTMKRRVLDELSRSELQDIANRYQLEVEDKRVKEQLVEAAARSRKVKLEDNLGEYSRDRLKELCRACGLDDAGREKALLVSRLAGATSADVGVLQANDRSSDYRAEASAKPVEKVVRRVAPRPSVPTGVSLPPTVGALAEVRQRQYLIEKVDPPTCSGELTRVGLVCLDDDASGRKLEVLWERELGARVYSPEGLGRIAHVETPRRFAAYFHALQWNTVTASDARLFQAPFRAGIKQENHQLVPLRKALELPRVNLFIADDVGVGKTIETGLVLRELLLRQRVDKILIVCPAALTLQWRAELERRFGLRFEVFTRQLVARRRQERGFGVNVWTTYPRFIVSYQMLRRPEHFDSLKVFLARPNETNLLVLDEAHHAAPSSDAKLYAVDSDTTERIRELAPLFEHRLFLSATPHNGHSNSFSALLEMLDPQRFTRGVPPAGPKSLEPVMVRRLKKDLRALGAGTYPERKTVQIDLTHEAGRWLEQRTGDSKAVDVGAGSDAELELGRLLTEYSGLVEVKGRGRLVLLNLQKRLLSSVAAFLRTLLVHARSVGLENLGKQPDEDDDGEDDIDVESAGQSDSEVDAEEDETVRAGSQTIAVPAGRARDVLAQMLKLARTRADEPGAKALALLRFVRDRQCRAARFGGADTDADGSWTDVRVLIFTEYADTKRYLRRLLNTAFEDTEEGSERIIELHGGMSDDRRDEVQAAFNSEPSDHPARVLLATDTAREGVNLQGQCADLFHFDIPWNPARMEQRNGRIDRALQPSPEVRCHYFFLPQREEDHVLRTLINKVATIQAELGSLGQVVLARFGDALKEGIDRATLERLAKAEALDDKRRSATSDLESQRALRKIEAEIEEAGAILDRSHRALVGFSPDMLREVVDVTLEEVTGHGLREMKVEGRTAYALPEMDALWQRALDTLRPPRPRDEPPHIWRKRPPKPVVFKPLERMAEEVDQLHLEHPLVQRLLHRFRTLGASGAFSRVTILRDPERSTSRVIAFGRLSLFGAGATRLHDEIIPVSARWAEANPEVHLKPFADTADSEALTDLERLFAQSATLDVPAAVQQRLLHAAEKDFANLWQHVDAEAQEVETRIRIALASRATTEATALEGILRDQRALIEKTLLAREGAQLELEGLLDGREREQRERDVVHMRRRLDEIAREVDTGPAQLRKSYEVTLRRLEPVGLVYLWPGSR